MSKTQVYDWYESFKEGREEVNDLPRSGRPSTSSTEENVDKIKEMVLENRLREIAQIMDLSHETARHILVDVLGMRKVATRLVSKDLNFLQKVNRNKVAEDMLERVNSDPTFIECIITGDETWVWIGLARQK
ncbi:protein GVQW3-like [Bactrocera neohumeralis]|uniref:protein GVQW3-like n=1 Tax=Bactrocera neohumeralis TaxID=98809 RepID=UPI002165C7C8|nr:protein GVQW3-like [Bactrocera neohumeralis]